MKLFTLDEANETLACVEPNLLLIQKLYGQVEQMRDASRAAAAASHFGGGMAGGTGYVNSLYLIGKMTSELQKLGVELKDPSRGLIDFPSLRAERVVYLCWQIGDGDEVGWWHETDAGYTGRQEL